MAYCEFHDSYSCEHGLTSSGCEQCSDLDLYAEGLCRPCWLAEHESSEFIPAPTCRRGDGRPVFAEGECYLCHLYR